MYYYLAHHGIEGMKWGQRNGPPYPLNYGQYSSAEKRRLKDAERIEKKLNKNAYKTENLYKKAKVDKYFRNDVYKKVHNGNVKFKKKHQKAFDSFAKARAKTDSLLKEAQEKGYSIIVTDVKARNYSKVGRNAVIGMLSGSLGIIGFQTLSTKGMNFGVFGPSALLPAIPVGAASAALSAVLTRNPKRVVPHYTITPNKLLDSHIPEENNKSKKERPFN